MIGDSAWYKITGALAAMAGGTADKYNKVPVPTASGDPAAAATDMTKLVAQLQDGLSKLPRRSRRAPTRSAVTSTATTSRPS